MPWVPLRKSEMDDEPKFGAVFSVLLMVALIVFVVSVWMKGAAQ